MNQNEKEKIYMLLKQYTDELVTAIKNKDHNTARAIMYRRQGVQAVMKILNIN